MVPKLPQGAPPGRSTVCVCVCVRVCVCVVGGKGGEVIMVRPEGSGLEEGGVVVGAGGKEQVKG